MVTEVDTTCDTSSLSVGVLLAEFNQQIVENLLDGAVQTLEDSEISSDSVTVYRVPGAFEIPGSARQVLEQRDHDGVICLGAVIRGETPHFDYICSHVSSGIGRLSMESDVPVVFGVLTTENRNQAIHRSSSSGQNKGAEAAEALLQSIGLYQAL